MVFGAAKNSGIKSIKKALGDEGAISERMRLKHISEQRDKEEMRRAKTSVEDKKRALERNKSDISHRETEMRRLQSELSRAQLSFSQIENEMKDEDEKVAALNRKHADLVFQLQKEKEKVVQDRTKIDKETEDIKHYEDEIEALKLRMVREKNISQEVDREIQALLVKIAHLSNDAEKAHIEANRAGSKKQYRDREREARKRAVKIIEDKRAHETSEIQRLHAENARLEQEIKTLELKVQVRA